MGPSLDAIEAVLSEGNIREVFGLLYALTKTHYISHILTTLLTNHSTGAAQCFHNATATTNAATSDAPPLATPQSLEVALGMNASAISHRWLLVQQTHALNSSSAYKIAQGIPDFQFPGFNSWVRFDFASINNVSQLLWPAGRIFNGTCGTCNHPRNFTIESRLMRVPGTVSMQTDDPRIQPPLSQREVAYQCAGTTPPCELKWQPGVSACARFTLYALHTTQANSASPSPTSPGGALPAYPSAKHPVSSHAPMPSATVMHPLHQTQLEHVKC